MSIEDVETDLEEHGPIHALRVEYTEGLVAEGYKQLRSNKVEADYLRGGLPG